MISSVRRGSAFAAATLLTVGLAAAAGAATPNVTGPSSSDAPYLVGASDNVSFTSLLTAGDKVGGYAMAGIPDGLGAFDNGDGTFTVLMNHELNDAVGAPRSHGATAGAFISRWVINKRTLKVVAGGDQIENLVTTGSKNLSRLCSADLAPVSAFYNPLTGKGYNGRIFLTGEENGSIGRAIAAVERTRTAYELGALGKAGWENLAANPSTRDRTVVVGQSDGGTGNVYVYAGTKMKSGNAVERAGLTNGVRKAISVTGFATERGDVAFPSTPQPFTLEETGTSFDRPEDGAWDPSNPNDYYFVTTGSMTKASRLWKVSFRDVRKPELGGTITKVLEGPVDSTPTSGGPKMMDNLTVTRGGQVLIQEDPGNNAYLAGIFQYDIKSGTIRQIAVHDAARFTTGGSLFDTLDEESSGIIPAPFLGAGKYLLADQNHKAVADPAQVEKGQLLVMSVTKPARSVGFQASLDAKLRLN